MLHIQPTKKMLADKRGFTIVELALVIVFLGVLVPIFSFLLVNMYQDSFYLNDKVKSNAETVQALLFMEEGVRNSASFERALPAQYTDFYGAHNAGSSGAEAWSYVGDGASARVLMTQNYSTTVNALSNGRQPVFVNTPDFNCTTDMYYQPQLKYLTIYFVKDSTLYRRILTDKTTALCAGNTQIQKQTCPPSIADASRDSSCEAYDEVLVNNVSSFSVNYFQINTEGASTPIDPTFSSSDADILTTVDYADVTITTTTPGGGESNSLTQRMTKVNP